MGRLVSPLSPFLSSSHQSVGGGGAPIHRRSTQQLHTPHQIMPALPTRKLCDSYSLRRSHQTGSLYISVLMRLLCALSSLPLHSDSICQGYIKSLFKKEENKAGFHVTGSLHEQFTCWYASHGAKWRAQNRFQLTTIYSFGATLRRLDLWRGNLGSKCQLVRKYQVKGGKNPVNVASFMYCEIHYI